MKINGDDPCKMLILVPNIERVLPKYRTSLTLFQGWFFSLLSPTFVVLSFTSTSLGPENYTCSSLCILPTFSPTSLQSAFSSLPWSPLLCFCLVSPLACTTVVPTQAPGCKCLTLNSSITSAFDMQTVLVGRHFTRNAQAPCPDYQGSAATCLSTVVV